MVRQVRLHKGQWLYSLVITDISEKDRQEYYQILYDRKHLLPRVVTMSVVGEIVNVVKGMTADHHRGERRLPRIPLSIAAPTDEAGEVEITDFNYRFVKFGNRGGLTDKLTVRLTPALSFTCVLDLECEGIAAERKDLEPLYEIENWKDLAVNQELREFLHRHWQANQLTGPNHSVEIRKGA